MKRNARLSTALLVAGALYASSAAADHDEGYRIKLIHMGDIHGHLVPRDNVRSDSVGRKEGGLAHMFSKIQSIRYSAAKKKIPTLLINTGDTIQGSAEALFTRGQAMIDVLNLFGINAYTPGNWDFLYGKERFLQAFVGTADTPPLAPWNGLAANLYFTGVAEDANALCPNSVGKRVMPAYKIFKAGKLKVGVLGVTTERGIPAIGPLATAGFSFTAGETETSCFVNHLRNVEAVDLVVMITELELGKNIDVAEAVPGIDVILSADMHEETSKAIVTSTGTIIVEEGQDGTALGELTLKVVNRKVRDYEWEQHRIDESIRPHKIVAAKIAQVRRPFLTGRDYKANQQVSIGGNTAKLLRPIDTVVGMAGVDIHRSNFAHDALPAAVEGTSHNLMADAFRWYAGSDFATVRGFRYGTHIKAGNPIRLEDLYHYMPIAARIGKAGPVSAWQLKDQVENSTRSVFDTNPRNWRGGWMFGYSGVTYDLDPYQPWGCRGSNIKVNGVSIEPKAEEPIAALSGLVNGEQQLPRNTSTATATISAGGYDKASGQFRMTVTVNGISPSNLTAAHIHQGGCGVSGGIIYDIGTAVWTATATGMVAEISGVIAPEYAADFLASNTYINLHTTSFAAGQIRGQIIATTTAGYSVAGYWYGDDPGTINNCGACAAGEVVPVVDEQGQPIDTTEIVVKYLAAQPNMTAMPAVNRINLLKPLPAPVYGFDVIQSLQGAE